MRCIIKVITSCFVTSTLMGLVQTSAQAQPKPGSQWNYGEITEACSGGDVGKAYVDEDDHFYQYNIDIMDWSLTQKATRLDKHLVRVRSGSPRGFYVYADRQWLTKICDYDGSRY